MKRRFAFGLSALALMAMFAIAGIGTASAHPITNEPTTGALRIHLNGLVNRICTSHRNPSCVSERGTFDGAFFLAHFDTYKVNGSLVVEGSVIGKITYKDGSTETFGRTDRLIRVESFTLIPGPHPAGQPGDLRLTFNSAYGLDNLQYHDDTEILNIYHLSFSVMSIEESRYVNPNRLVDLFKAPQVAGQALALNELLGYGDIS